MMLFIWFSLISLNFLLANGHHNPHYKPNHSVIVHLYEWKFADIANECETFLGPNGFGGVQVSPVNENVILDKRPWFERYQPISYRIVTRSGDEEEFAEMVARCNRVGVRTYVDVIINHMAAGMELVGTGNSTANASERLFPAVPYDADDFHPKCSIHDVSYRNDANEVRNCALLGLPDLDQESSYVREKITEFLNRLIDHGVAGFRVDAARHMSPNDLDAIYGGLKPLKTPEFAENSEAFIYQEVIDRGGEAVRKEEYTQLGVVTEFRHSYEVGKAFSGGNDLKWLESWGPQWALLPSEQALVFVDNHDNQREHGSADDRVLTHKTPQRYIVATAFMLAHSYGIPRVMSSFAFESWAQGPPSAANGHIISPEFNANGQCTNGWVCEHRWPAIRKMVAFRNVVGDAPVVNFWSNGKNQIAFSRGTRGFIAINIEPFDLNAKLFTSLPNGEYCDVITGDVDGNGDCTGTKVVVNENGEAQINLLSDVGVLAIHIAKQSRIIGKAHTTSDSC